MAAVKPIVCLYSIGRGELLLYLMKSKQETETETEG
ncbi:hypothetical protein C8D94_101977 [Marinirhabdus gelatinilytica]|uniref:Uncharacterized protein n=1 Tax=Marinirhabdus gelatinilytica TaxID=1703343 RepID=A0A370QL46_9FLAO|nr:hypothetical protein C8D94_101976 [Marinirhabdus gelatinilytica]RDK89097.1 hypothetical protein C8D94_101977 [Marinirhabdus gelatinilytica]